MMLRLAFLGIIQGLTEFLPVSSSAHLVFAEAILGIPRPGVFLEAILHLGTLVALVVAFREDLVAIAPGGSRCNRQRLPPESPPAKGVGQWKPAQTGDPVGRPVSLAHPCRFGPDRSHGSSV